MDKKLTSPIHEEMLEKYNIWYKEWMSKPRGSIGFQGTQGISGYGDKKIYICLDHMSYVDVPSGVRSVFKDEIYYGTAIFYYGKLEDIEIRNMENTYIGTFNHKYFISIAELRDSKIDSI